MTGGGLSIRLMGLLGGMRSNDVQMFFLPERRVRGNTHCTRSVAVVVDKLMLSRCCADDFSTYWPMIIVEIDYGNMNTCAVCQV